MNDDKARYDVYIGVKNVMITLKTSSGGELHATPNGDACGGEHAQHRDLRAAEIDPEIENGFCVRFR